MIRISPIRVMTRTDLFLPIRKRAIVQILFLRMKPQQTFAIGKTQTLNPNSHTIPLALDLVASLSQPPQKYSDVSSIALGVWCGNEDAKAPTTHNQDMKGPDKAA